MKNVTTNTSTPRWHAWADQTPAQQPAPKFTDVAPQDRRQLPRLDTRLEAQSPSTLGMQFQFLSPDDLANLAATSKHLNVAVNQSPAFRTGAAGRLKTALGNLKRAEDQLQNDLRPYEEEMHRLKAEIESATRAIDAPSRWYMPNAKSKRRDMVEQRGELESDYRNVNEEFEMMEYGSREGMEQLRAEVATCQAEFSASMAGITVRNTQSNIADATGGQEPIPRSESVVAFAPTTMQRQRRFNFVSVPSANRSARANLEKLPDSVSKVVTGFLTPQDMAHLTETSRTLRRDVREHVRYAEPKRFQDAREAHLAFLVTNREWRGLQLATAAGPIVVDSREWKARGESLKASELYRHTHYTMTCIGIAQARAARGEPHAVFEAMSAAGRFLANPDVTFLSYEDERLLVEARLAHGTRPFDARDVHVENSLMRQGPDAVVTGLNSGDRRQFRLNIAVLEAQLAEVATADLRSATDPLAPRQRQCPVVYIEHFKDEAFEPDGMIEVTHTFPDGTVQTARKPRPDSNAGESMVTFKFTQAAFLGQTYAHVFVHVFNLDRPVIDMEAPD